MTDKKLEIKNAIIESAEIRIEDHGILTADLLLNYGGTGQGFGGRAMDTYDEELKRRVGTAWGCEYILRLLNTLGVNSWRALVGTYLRVEKEPGGPIHRIGHIIEDKWFDPTEIQSYLAQK